MVLMPVGLLLAAAVAAAMEGRVTDPQGRARQGCAVSAFVSAESRPSHPRPVGDTLSDRLGHFALPLETPGAHDITVRGCGAAVTVPNVKPPGGLAPIVVPDAGRVRGRVGDAAGRPVAEARLRARSLEASGAMVDVIQIETRLDGSFDMAAAPAGLVELTISRPGFLDTTTRLVVEAGRRFTRADLVLWRGGRVAGRVRTKPGESAPTAEVELSWQDPVNPTPVQRKPLSPQGAFLFDRIPRGEAVLSLLDGESVLRTTGVEVREGETTTVDLGTRPTLVSGRVTRNSDPLAGAMLALLGQGSRSLSATTGEDGSYGLLVGEPGRYLARVTTDGKLPLPVRTVEIPEAEWFGLDLDFETAVVEGVVLDAGSGKAVGQAHVFASPKTPGAAFGETRANGEGRFHLELTPGEHRLTVQAPGYDRQAQDLTAGASRALRIRLHRGGRLQGAVIGPDGLGVAGVPVSAAGGDPVSSSQWERATITEGDGTFALDGLGQGPCDVAAGSEAVGFATRAAVTAGEEPVLLRLTPGGRAQVRVRDEAGGPVAGAVAVVTGIYGARASVPGLAVSDSQGTLVMPTPAGTVWLRVIKGLRWSDVPIDVPSGGVGTAETVLATAPR
jgi:hypothetical protein